MDTSLPFAARRPPVGLAEGSRRLQFERKTDKMRGKVSAENLSAPPEVALETGRSTDVLEWLVSPLDPNGIGRVLVFWARASAWYARAANLPGALTCDLLSKFDGFLGLHGVAPG